MCSCRAKGWKSACLPELQMMKISVKVKTRATENAVLKKDAAHFEVRVKAAPIGGKANEAVEKTLAEYFDVPRSQVAILRGHTSKNKLVEIL